MKKVFLTGASGFIGKAVLDQLESKNYVVSVLSRSSVPSHGIQGDFSEISKIKSHLQVFGPDVAVLLGWQGLPDYRLDTCLTNLRQQLELVEVLIETGCKRIILAGSCWQYGGVQGEVSESFLGGEIGIFGQTKNALYNLACSIAHGKKTEIVEGRVFFSYGPGQRGTSLIPIVLKSLINGDRPSLKSPYDAMDFIHVDDVARAFELLIRSPELQGVYNISSNQSCQVSELVNIACEALGKDKIYSAHEKGQDWWGNNKKMRELGFTEITSIQAGVSNFINKIRDRSHAL